MSKKRHGPPPLRSSNYPDGLPHLRGMSLTRVRKANVLYKFMCDLIFNLDAQAITWTVENPWTSFLWETSYWRKVQSLSPIYCELHNCMFGGERLKRTCLASNNPAVLQLNILCDNQHAHKPWSFQQGQFDTAREAEYTPQFAKALATAVVASLTKANQLDQFAISSKKLKKSQFAAIGAHVQPQRSLPELVPEFSCLLVLRGLPLTIPFNLDSKSSLSHCVRISDESSAPLCIPCGSKQLRLTFKKGEYRQLSWEFVQVHSLQDVSDGFSGASISGASKTMGGALLGQNCSCVTTCWEVQADQSRTETAERVFGIRWTPKEFMRKASMVQHPFDSCSGLDPVVQTACEVIAREDPGNLKIARCKMLGRWLAAAKKLAPKDKTIKDSMSSERRHIMSSKKLALTQWVIDEMGYEDVDLAKDMAMGFSLVGDVPKSGRLPDKLVPAQLAVEDLRSQASKSAKAIRYMTRSSGDVLVDAQLWEKTLSEVDSGWLVGWSHGMEKTWTSRRSFSTFWLGASKQDKAHRRLQPITGECHSHHI